MSLSANKYLFSFTARMACSVRYSKCSRLSQELLRVRVAGRRLPRLRARRSLEPGKGGDKPGGDKGKGCYSYTTEAACEAAAPEQHCKWFPGDPSSGKEALW